MATLITSVLRPQTLVATKSFLSLSKPLHQRNIMSGPVSLAIQGKLTQNLSPVHLEVINESYMHNVPQGSETHFKVVVVSQEFKDLKLIGRHRLVNSLLEEELKSGVHALSIVAKTPEQWGEGAVVEKSPACRGGFGK